ncbi:MAG: DUF2027 domain-containing protein [Bacteroidales bacterium]|nr:DUF2027 domain-containing protein [Bacteroidales bacterium]
MEKFQIGDKVNFLNATGGGTVKKIIDTRMVEVTIEDGFDIPVLMSDLVLDYRSQPDRRQQVVDNVQKEIQQKQIIEEKEMETARKSALRRFGRNAEEEGLYLAFVPQDQQWLLTGLLDVVLVNNTPADALYSFNIKEEEKYISVDYGSIAPHSKVVIESISREDIEYWCEGYIQVILSQEEADFVYHPLHAPFSFRSSRFFKDGSYVESGVLGEKAVMISLSSLIALKGTETDFTKMMKEGGPKSVSSNQKLVKEKAAIDKHQTAPGEAIVDLHIGELVDNILGMSSNDIFRIQINYFKKMLESAITNEYDKVTFIHGVGNGVLKNAIIDELKNYENTSNRMASIMKFGVGAIDVMIKEKGA